LASDGKASDQVRPSWWRPASGIPASGSVHVPSRASARTRTGAGADPSQTEPHPSRERSGYGGVAEAYAEWLQGRGMRVFGTINTRWPLSVRRHVAAGKLLQDLYQVECGERPTVMVPCQRNPSRDGYHSHPSLFGSEELLRVRRSEVWRELMARLSHEAGIGVETVSLAGVSDSRGQANYHSLWAEGEAGWARLQRTNEPRVRLEPVKSFEDCLGYAIRYASRETDVLEVLPGDRWRSGNG